MADMSASYLIQITTGNDEKMIPVEKRYPPSLTIRSLKDKLELITGVSAGAMQLSLIVNDASARNLTDDHDGQTLGDILAGVTSESKIRLQVVDTQNQLSQLQDLSQVPKFELTEEEYAARGDTLRAFKEKLKIGRFSDKPEEDEERRLEDLKLDYPIESRCEVRVKGKPSRRGTVMYVGAIEGKPGYWIGVKYDEPLGVNDGSVNGKSYFSCPPKYGGFIRPVDVFVGDFPELGLEDL